MIGGALTGRPRSAHPDNEAVVEAALKCFLRTGFHAATMREIAAEADESH